MEPGWWVVPGVQYSGNFGSAELTIALRAWRPHC
jgi:hypothetical protein